MSKQIWKFPLESAFREPYPEVVMPKHAVVVHADFQGDQLCLWAAVNASKHIERVNRRFGVFGTGWPIPGNAFDHIATVQKPPFVWHIFELPA